MTASLMGGFYTQEQCKDIIAYAAARNIVIIPEIDLPGHMLAALACLSPLGLHGRSLRSGTNLGREQRCALCW